MITIEKHKCVKCGSDKKSPKHKHCLICRNKFIKNKEVCRFVKDIELKGGYCDMADIYKLLSLWVDTSKRTNKYDQRPINIQIEKMWIDLKKIYNDSQNF